MKAVILVILVCIFLEGCRQAPVEPSVEPTTRDLSAQLQSAKATLAGILPEDMSISRAEVSERPEGKGIMLHVSPKDGDKAHPSLALFLWPNGNPKDIAYETGEGAHTFARIGSSDEFRVYYSNLSGFLKYDIQQGFCTEEKR